MTTRTVPDNIILELQERISRLKREIATYENNRVINLPVRKSTELPVGSEGDLVICKDNTTVYVFINGAWVSLLGGVSLTGTEWDTTIIKTVDESVTNSTTMQDDDELHFVPLAGEAYLIQVTIVYSSPLGAGTPDFKMWVGEDTTPRGWLGVWSGGYSPTNIASFWNGQSELVDQNAGGNTKPLGTGPVPTFHDPGGSFGGIRGSVAKGAIMGNGGTWRVQWAQNTANANPTVVHAGSRLQYKHVKASYP